MEGIKIINRGKLLGGLLGRNLVWGCKKPGSNSSLSFGVVVVACTHNTWIIVNSIG